LQAAGRLLRCYGRRPLAQLTALRTLAGRFQAKFERCLTRFQEACIGPAHAAQEERLLRAQRRESGRFVRDYNDRIFNGLVIASLADILLFRFLVRVSILETLGWVAFAFLQVGACPPLLCSCIIVFQHSRLACCEQHILF
jgi:hypothetical protein